MRFLIEYIKSMLSIGIKKVNIIEIKLGLWGLGFLGIRRIEFDYYEMRKEEGWRGR